ncbi:hypothetical protein [Lapillicoccus sp.]|uniref:hypothetical protein n=1 Tax=Lapillicoccus sp. TaxID=1909287 RepID=UPI0025F371B1|nr:hypothetical protein [Lapillicoccus sp.]
MVTATLDGDVLAILALAEVAFTTGQLQRMLPKGSTPGTAGQVAAIPSGAPDEAGNTPVTWTA